MGVLNDGLRTGQRVRVTLRADVIATDDEALAQLKNQPVMMNRSVSMRRFLAPKMIAAAAGTVYEGILSDVDWDGFFDLNLTSGETISFYEGDPCLVIEVLSE